MGMQGMGMGMQPGPNDMPGMIGLTGMAGLGELKLKDGEGNELTPEEIRDMDADELEELIQEAREEAMALAMAGGPSHHARLPEGVDLYKLVQAHRPAASGEMVKEVGVIHELHDEDATLTVQFLSDQMRRRMSISEVKPVTDLTPYYPAVVLKPGEIPPTAKQQDQEFDEEQGQRELGLMPPQWQEIQEKQDEYEEMRKKDQNR